jgi:hypothetical protein
VKSSQGVECGESLLQGVHRSRFRLSVEEIVQRNKGKSRRKAQEGERWKYSRKGVLELLVKASGKDLFSEGEE